MPFYPITLSHIRDSRDRRVMKSQDRRPGMAGASQQIPASQERLSVAVSGTQRQVFIFGLHDPDDADADYYIP